MRLEDIANVTPAVTVDTKNPIRYAIRSRKTADIKAALLQSKRNKDGVDNAPIMTVGGDIKDCGEGNP